MLKRKIVPIVLTALVLNVSLFHSAAYANSAARKKAEKVKAAVTKLGVGKDARIFVKQKDGTKLKGYITEIKAESFVVKNDSTGTSSEIDYTKAKQVKGNNLSTGVKIAIGIGILVGIIVLVALLSDDVI